MHTLITLLSEAEEPAKLFMPNWAFPLIAAVGFVFFAFVVWSYRDVANRHSDKIKPGAGDHGHGAANHGAAEHGDAGHGSH